MDLRKKADYIRSEIIRVAVKNGAGHIASSLSSVDILTALYYGVINYRPRNSLWLMRDRVVFSKAHGCYGLYAILADKKIIPAIEWKNFYTQKSTLSGCADHRLKYGLEAGCGSLGHGLPIAVGMAFSAKLQKSNYKVFCVVGDGEMQEGSNWEALQFAVKHGLDNLTLIVDCNGLQAMGRIVNILDRTAQDLKRRLSGFGLLTVTCNGHAADDLARTIKTVSAKNSGTPHAVIARTIKGCGLRCMENVAKFHFRIPTPAELDMGKTYEA
jgi:transketolase